MSTGSKMNPNDPLAGVEREILADSLRAQNELLERELWFMGRYMLSSPATIVARFGGGAQNQPQQTFDGDGQDPYSGIAVLNPTAVPVALGFEAGAAALSAYVVPAFSYLVLPQRFVNCSLGIVNATDAAGPAVAMTIARLRVPPLGVLSGPYGSPPGGAKTVDQGGIADTVQVANGVVAPAAGAVIAQLLAPPAGIYSLQVVTAAVGDPNQPANLQLWRGGQLLGGLLSPATPIPVTRERMTLNGTQVISVVGINAGAPGSVYSAFIAATQIA